MFHCVDCIRCYWLGVVDYREAIITDMSICIEQIVELLYNVSYKEVY